jgi:glutamyl-tRNA synthetase
MQEATAAGKKLAALLFPNVTGTIADLEKRFPERDLPEGAKVTRLGPSPTGFIHIGNLYGAMIDERLAHQSGGKFLLRIEDTDDKRRVEGAEELILHAMDFFGIHFDEGVTKDGDKGDYGPYHQSQRGEIYHIVAKSLVERGLAYPSFATEDDLAKIREDQEKQKVATGYYGKWALDRTLTYDEVEKRIQAGLAWTLRVRSFGDPNETQIIPDGIRGHVTIHPNDQDFVLLKTNGIPTYHFAHVVDDHFMRVTHVVRGEEWLATLPFHIELFDMLGWEHPVYCHNAHLMKIDETGTRRKLSKRKDPEMSLSFYEEKGYFPQAVREYLMTLINSNYEEWRLANPTASMEEFPVQMEKMANSGALFDMVKLEDVSKETLVHIDAREIADYLLQWARIYQPEAYAVLCVQEDVLVKVLDIGRNGKKPRKDLMNVEQILQFIRYFFDAWFTVEDSLPENIPAHEAAELLQAYLQTFDFEDDNETWFNKVREIASERGYAVKMKDYKKHPEEYKGSVGDVSAVIRLAVTGRRNSPDLWTVQQLLGKEKTIARVNDYILQLS